MHNLWRSSMNYSICEFNLMRSIIIKIFKANNCSERCKQSISRFHFDSASTSSIRLRALFSRAAQIASFFFVFFSAAAASFHDRKEMSFLNKYFSRKISFPIFGPHLARKISTIRPRRENEFRLCLVMDLEIFPNLVYSNKRRKKSHLKFIHISLGDFFLEAFNNMTTMTTANSVDE